MRINKSSVFYVFLKFYQGGIMMSPSYPHAYVSGKIIARLHQFEQYSVFSELTLQLDKDYIADVCLYPKRPINFAAGDIIKVTEMPLLIVEVLSPTQGIQEILDKFAKFLRPGSNRAGW